MARGSKRVANEGPPFDFVLYENTGEDPRPRIEFPEGVDVGTLANAYTDALAAVYSADVVEDGESDDGAYVAVLVVVVKAPTARAAAKRMITDAASVAKAMLQDAANADAEEP